MAGEVGIRGTAHIDSAALGRALSNRNGAVGRIMGGFASLATVETKNVARGRVKSRSGEYLAGISSKVIGSPTGPRALTTAAAGHSAVLERGSRPHIITPRSAQVLRFTAGGVVVYTRRVRHPGTRPYNIVRDGVRRAGRRISNV